MAKPDNVPNRFGPHVDFPGQGKANGRPAFVDDLIPFDRSPDPVCIEVSIDVGSLLTPEVLDAAGNDFCFTDNLSTITYVILQNFGSGDKIDVSGACPGDYNFARSFDDANDLVITYSNPAMGEFTQIVIDDVLPDAGSVFDLSSAIAAVGFEFISFDRTELSIDVGSIITDALPTTIDASGAAYCLLDDSDVNTFVRIEGFSSDDHIDVTGASAGDYSFSTSVDDANDLVIVYSQFPGAVNYIVIDNVLSGDDIVSDYASAVAEVGYAFMTFA